MENFNFAIAAATPSVLAVFVFILAKFGGMSLSYWPLRKTNSPEELEKLVQKALQKLWNKVVIIIVVSLMGPLYGVVVWGIFVLATMLPISFLTPYEDLFGHWIIFNTLPGFIILGTILTMMMNYTLRSLAEHEDGNDL